MLIWAKIWFFKLARKANFWNEKIFAFKMPQSIGWNLNTNLSTKITFKISFLQQSEKLKQIQTVTPHLLRLTWVCTSICDFNDRDMKPQMSHCSGLLGLKMQKKTFRRKCQKISNKIHSLSNVWFLFFFHLRSISFTIWFIFLRIDSRWCNNLSGHRI